MKKIIKLSCLLLSFILLVGCFGTVGPAEKTEDLLSKYVKNDKDIMDELNVYIDKQDLNASQKERYKNIIKDEYKTIKYDIKNETIDGDNANVEVQITVKDLYKASQTAENYLIDNPKEFYTDGVYDPDKFIDYKLKSMEESKDTVTYTINIKLVNKDSIWTIEDLNDETLEKIHGIYNYEKNND